MRLLRVNEVVRMVGFSKATLYRRIRAESFPKPIALGAQTSVFLEGEILEWMNAQAEQRRGYCRSAISISAISGKAQGGRNV
jgi:prophage regulatory protein